jgi:hypothetical protein
MGGPAGGSPRVTMRHALVLHSPRNAPGRVSPEDLETVPTAELLSELKRRKPLGKLIWTQLDGIPMNSSLRNSTDVIGSMEQEPISHDKSMWTCGRDKVQCK